MRHTSSARDAARHPLNKKSNHDPPAPPAAATLYLVGLIWFAQLVHYPLMANVGQQHYSTYPQRHERNTTWAVAPAMLIEHDPNALRKK